MKTISLEEMLDAYGLKELTPDDRICREALLSKYRYSLIVEGTLLELDNIEVWIKIHIGYDAVQYLHYCKIGNDYGYAEFFFSQKKDLLAVGSVVPRIYTTYQFCQKPGKISKTEGYNNEILYDQAISNAIVY